MQIIPIKATANQSLQTNIGGQAAQINLYAKSTGLFMDVLVNNAPIVSGVLCQDRNRIVRSNYLGFVGDLSFVDLQGTNDPAYTQLGSRFILAYLEAADLTAMGYLG